MKIFLNIIGILILISISLANLSSQSLESSKDRIFKDFKAELLWEAEVKIGEMLNLGESKRGERRIIPILGGTFSGSNINGVILPMGADWQLVRPDGVTELYARYLLKTDDGYIIQIINKVLMHEGSEFYCKSVIDLEAPINSPYEYLNHAVFIGTLGFPDLKLDEDPYVIIGVYKLL